MKIAFMAYDKPDYFGGPITNARRLLPELQKRGHEVHAMIFFNRDSPATKYFLSRGIQCHSIERPKCTERQINWILKILRTINPDVFVPNIFVSGWYAAKWVQKAGIPAVAVHRSDDAYHWGMVKEFVVGTPAWSVSGLVCVSQYIERQVQELQPQLTKLCVIPSGVPIPHQKSQQTDPLRLVYVGRLIQQQKRIHETLDAFICLALKLPDIHITLIGDGDERALLEQKVSAANLSERIQFKGTIDPEYLHVELVNYNILVLLSDYEGMPGAVMDGMSCGLVPICLNIGNGIDELVVPDKTGFLVADRGPTFEYAVEYLYSNREARLELADAARQHIIQEYSISVAASRWENFLSELIQESCKRRKIPSPLLYKLPKVKCGLDREDKRYSSVITRIYSKMVRKLKFQEGTNCSDGN